MEYPSVAENWRAAGQWLVAKEQETSRGASWFSGAPDEECSALPRIELQEEMLRAVTPGRIRASPRVLQHPAALLGAQRSRCRP